MRGAFDLPDHLAAKDDPRLIACDEQHLAAIEESLERSIADLTERLDSARRAPAGRGQQALDRDLEVHRLTARLRLLRRFGLDLRLGHMVRTDDPEPVYVGRIGLKDSAGEAPRPARRPAPSRASRASQRVSRPHSRARPRRAVLSRGAA